MKLVFCGTPPFAVPAFEALRAAGHEIPLVVSQPDRPVGRAQQMTAPPVKQTAVAAGIGVVQPEKIRNNLEFRAQLEVIAPDSIVVVAYGRIIPPWMLALPRIGCINLHGSLLPKYRGAAPIQWSVAMGDAVTGNTTMLLEEGLDTGPILLQQSVEIGPSETASDLFVRLAEAGAPLLVETLAGLEDGSLQPRAQNHEGATYAPILDREDGRMDFVRRSARELYNRWRGFQPWPGAFTMLDGKKLIVHRMAIARPKGRAALSDAGTGSADPDSIQDPDSIRSPGSIHVEEHRFFVACAENTWLEFVELQLEGKKRMTASQLLRGMQIPRLARLGPGAQ